MSAAEKFAEKPELVAALDKLEPEACALFCTGQVLLDTAIQLSLAISQKRRADAAEPPV